MNNNIMQKSKKLYKKSKVIIHVKSDEKTRKF